MAEAIVIDFQITPDDLVEYRIWCEFHRLSARLTRRRLRRRAAWTGLVSLVIIATLVWFWYVPGGVVAAFVYRHGLPRGVFAAFRICGLLLTLVGPWFCAWWLFRAAAVFTAPGEVAFARTLRRRARALFGDQARAGRLSITPEGVGHSVNGAEFSIPWNFYEAIHETPTLIVSSSRGGGEGFLPKRCIGAGAEGQARTDQIMAWARAKGGTQEAALNRLLAESDVRCPDCGYNLRGLESTVCPECGIPLEAHFLRRKRRRF